MAKSLEVFPATVETTNSHRLRMKRAYEADFQSTYPNNPTALTELGDIIAWLMPG